MTAKKHFLSGSEDFNKNLDISWSSSNSEDTTATKKFKSNHHSENNILVSAWVKMGHSARKFYSNTPDDNSLNICSQFTCTTTYLQEEKPSISSNHTFEESPIIGTLKLGEVSPILGVARYQSIEKSRTSPIIGKHRTSPIIGKRLSKIRKAAEGGAHKFRPELFRTYSHQQTVPVFKGNDFNHFQSPNKKEISTKARKQCNNVQQLEHTSKLNHLYVAHQSDTVIRNISPSFMEVELNKMLEKSICSDEPIKSSHPVIESDSPTTSQLTTFSIISEQSYDNSLNYTIDPFHSQECSEVTPYAELIQTPISQEICDAISPQISDIKTSLNSIINTSLSSTSNEIKTITEITETPSTKSSNVEPLYHEIPPKKKKRYKKNGLADQLQKALHKQKTDFAIWRHELYLKKTKGQAFTATDESPGLILKINKFWMEYSITVVECELIEGQSESANTINLENSAVQAEYSNLEVIRLGDNDSVNVSRKCLVIIGFNITHSLRIKINAKLKLCMPYKTKIVKYNGESIFCYFNVSKLLAFK